MTSDGGRDCLACGLADGTVPLPGGTILRTSRWTVEHCVGALGVGTLVVQPARTPDIDRHGGAYGPALQMAMFAEGASAEPRVVEEFCGRVRRALDEGALDEDSAIQVGPCANC
ncbi:hypothetical protein ACFVXC_42345 [Streptomyces sp. NPDC058257]|uniref:hypothetical protein n=1 Tax=Streptomyces sp. NPDC058257 TaxID=3346409 RepID=UPI0036E6F16F